MQLDRTQEVGRVATRFSQRVVGVDPSESPWLAVIDTAIRWSGKRTEETLNDRSRIRRPRTGPNQTEVQSRHEAQGVGDEC